MITGATDRRLGLEETTDAAGRTTRLLCGIPVRIFVEDSTVADRFDELLHHFAFQPAGLGEGPPLQLRLVPGSVRGPVVDAELVDDGSQARVRRVGSRFWVDTGQAMFDVSSEGHQAMGHIAPGFWTQPIDQQRAAVMQVFVILLRSRHRFVLHASGVEKDGAGVIFVGNSGSGKTTVTLSLLTAGWRFLGDDMVALARSGDRIDALALRRTMSCSTTTLAGLGLGAGSAGEAKAEPAFDPVESLSVPVIDSMSLRSVVFPTVTDSRTSELELLGSAETVGILARSMAGIFTDPNWAQIQLATLAELSSRANGYRLRVGRDVFDDPARVSRLVQSADRT